MDENNKISDYFLCVLQSSDSCLVILIFQLPNQGSLRQNSLGRIRSLPNLPFQIYTHLWVNIFNIFWF